MITFKAMERICTFGKADAEHQGQTAMGQWRLIVCSIASNRHRAGEYSLDTVTAASQSAFETLSRKIRGLIASKISQRAAFGFVVRFLTA